MASSFQSYEPYPLFMTDARGSRIRDVDGNEYIDFDMAFGVLAAGHSHPDASPRSWRARVANGTCYTFPVEDGIILAEEIKRRFGCDLVRFSNSGTEATMDAIRVARGFTGREKLLKFEGGYHGHHDDVLVSIQPPRELIGPGRGAERPSRPRPDCRARASMRRSSRRTTIPRRWRRSSTATAGEIAAIIVEPVQFNIGVVPPLPGFLERVRELATAHGSVLIFDEVKTGRGARLRWRDRVVRRQARPVLPGQEHRRRRADRRLRRPRRGHGRDRAAARVASGRGDTGTALEHSTIPGGATRVAHLGTFNGNPLSMAAGVAVLTRILTRDVYPRLQAMGDRLTAGCQAVVDEFGLPGYAVNVGPKGCVMFTPGRG